MICLYGIDQTTRNKDLDEALFAFENYLKGTGVHRDRWSVVAMPLLTGSALRAYTNFAQPMGASGISPTWEQFKAVLQPFARPDKQITSRQSLYSIKQTKSVTEYHQRFLLLVSRAGSPAPTDKDLLMLYWNGLSDEAQKTSIIDPTTGKFWESFTALSSHTLAVSLAKSVSGIQKDSPLKRPWQNKLKLRAMQATHKRARSEGGRGGGGRGGGRGGRGGRNGGPGRGRGDGRGNGRTAKDYNRQLYDGDSPAASAGPSDPFCNDSRHGDMKTAHRVSQCRLKKQDQQGSAHEHS